MFSRIPKKPFPDEILRLIAEPVDPRAHYRRVVGKFVFEPLISIESQALLRKAVRLAGIDPKEVNLPPVPRLKDGIEVLNVNSMREIKQYLKEEPILDNLALIKSETKKTNSE